MVGQANQVAQTPYTGYGGELVAGLNGQQNTGIGGVNQYANAAQPALAGAAGLTLAGAGQANAQQFGGLSLSQYMSPYQNSVVNATQAELQNQDVQQAQSLAGNTIGAGAFGGDRAGIAQAALAGQQDLANNSTIANLNNANYTQALGEFNNQQTTNLGAQQANLARLSSAGLNLGNIGTSAQTAGLQGSAAQLQAGTIQQQTQQAQDTAAYNQFLQQQAYPFQTEQYLANISEGIGSNSGGTSTSSQSAPSAAAGAIGAGLGLFSLLARGGRVGRDNGGGVGGLVIPYASNATNESSWVPQTGGLSLGHSIPTAQPANQNTPQAQLNNQLMQSGLKSAGTALQNSSIGDAIQDFGTETLGLARGGIVPHRAAGGSSDDGDYLSAFTGAPDVSPIAALAAKYGNQMPAPQQTPTSGGLSLPSNVAQYANQMPAPQQGLALPGAGDLPAPSASPAGLVAPPPSAAHVPTWNEVQADNAAGTATIAARGGLSLGPTNAGASGGLSLPSASSSSDVEKRMWQQESGGNQFNADGTPLTSPKGAIGMAQIMPSTGPAAAKLAGLPWDPAKLANDPSYNLALGHAYYQSLLKSFGSPDLAAAAYNAGPGAVQSAQAKAASSGGSWLSYMPAETQNYVASVTGNKPLSGAPAAAAINGASRPAGGLSLPPDAPPSPRDGLAGFLDKAGFTTPPGSGSSAAPSSQRSAGLFGLNLSDPVRTALLSAGLGIMASPSHNLAMAIGQGGLQGVSAYQQSQKLQNEAGLNRAQIGNLNSEAEARPQEIAMKAKQLDLQVQQIQRQIAAGGVLAGNGASSVNATPALAPPQGGLARGVQAPTVSVPQPSQGAQSTKVSAPLPAPTDNFWSGVPDLENPTVLNQRAQQIATLNPELAGQLMTKAQAIVTRGTVMKNGQLVPIPGYTASQAAVESAKTSAQESAKAPYDMVEVQPEAGGPTQLVPKSTLVGSSAPKGTVVGPGAGSPPGSTIDAAASADPIIKSQPAFYAERQKQIAADEGTMMDQFQSRQLSKQRLQALAGIMQTYQPGAFAEQKGDLIAHLRAVGIPVPSTATANPAAFQEFVKNATANVFNDVKSMGGRVLVSEIQGLTKANANPELQPEAAAAIIGQGLGVINYEDQHTQDYFNWKKQNPAATQTADFEIPWAKDHPVAQYVDQATKGIGYQGQTIPPAEKRTTGQTYLTPKGPMVWRGNGWERQ